VQEREKKVSYPWEEFQYSPPTQEEVKKWIDKVQKFLWKERSKLKGKAREIILRDLYTLAPDTALAGEAAYARWKERIKKREKRGEYYAILKSGEDILKSYPHLKEKKSLGKALADWEKKYSVEKTTWEKKVGKVENIEFYEKFLALFPDSSWRGKAYEELLSLYEKGGKYAPALKLLLAMEKEKYPGVLDKADKIVGKVEDIGVLVEYYSAHPEQEVQERIKSLLPEEKNLEVLNKLLKISSGALREEVIKRIEVVSEEKYQEARLEEVSGNLAKARKIYWGILKNAPKSKAAERIRKDLKRKAIIRNCQPPF